MGQWKANATAVRIQAATFLSLGWAQQQTADHLQISRSTIQRWLVQKEFTDLIATLRETQEAAFTGVAMENAEGAAASFKKELERYRKDRQAVYILQIDTVMHMLRKLNTRIQDLPDDSIMPQQLSALMTAVSTVSETAFNGWAQMIGIDEMESQVAEIKMTLEQEFAIEADAALPGGEVVSAEE